MAKNCTLMAPIESASGKIAPSTQKRLQGGWGRFFGFRTINNKGAYGTKPVPRIVMAFYSKVRSTAYTAEELDRWNRFSAVSKATAEVMHNPQKLQIAQTEFAAQTTFKKLRDYVWHREWNNYVG